MGKPIVLRDPELVAELLAYAAVREAEYPGTADLMRSAADRIRELDRSRSAMMVALRVIRRGMETLQDVGEELPTSPTPDGTKTLRQMLTEYHGLLIKDIGKEEEETGWPALVARGIEGDMRRMLMDHHHAFGALDDSHLPELPPPPRVSG